MSLFKKIVFVLCVTLMITGCGIDERSIAENSNTIIDDVCEHEWVEVQRYSDGLYGIYYDVYCPKCKSEQRVSSKEWKIIEADREYKNSQD